MISSISEFITSIISIICLAINHIALWWILKCTLTQQQPSYKGTEEKIRAETAFLDDHKPKATYMLWQMSHITILLGLPLQTYFINEHRETEEGCWSSQISKSWISTQDVNLGRFDSKVQYSFSVALCFTCHIKFRHFQITSTTGLLETWEKLWHIIKQQSLLFLFFIQTPANGVIQLNVTCTVQLRPRCRGLDVYESDINIFLEEKAGLVLPFPWALARTCTQWWWAISGHGKKIWEE